MRSFDTSSTWKLLFSFFSVLEEKYFIPTPPELTSKFSYWITWLVRIWLIRENKSLPDIINYLKGIRAADT